ncbi:MAG: ATP synthase F0 subunit B [Candidatus Nealsonbacteria bacterium CG08_land_8_20_14_0_20_38_20]|uniref:ATP synthase subunit b n=1 Tax=Candidatus Nealsonbacteria bacterium CG08_land_8_20_14_0_20_38_20 TaxID=1974705 RepID=A0A2H0YLB8_9BACT|nr:MAG: ATP synthase F0 subunit B [Candidatus Nealsonbacteria bacterium CG08_land_8_20_14_0_20_38_20]
MGIFESLGINWKILLGQIVNFLLVLYLLKRFALKPFLKILNERKEKIEGGVKNAENAERKIQLAGEERDKILKEGREKANLILKKSEERGKGKEEEILRRTEEEKMRILAEAKRLGQIEVNKMKGEFSKKNLELVLNLTEKILKEKVDLKKDSEIIKSFLSRS